MAAVFGIIPEEEQMFYYYGREGKVEVYESSVEFFITGDIQSGPEVLRMCGLESVTTGKVTRKDLFWIRLKQKLGLVS